MSCSQNAEEVEVLYYINFTLYALAVGVEVLYYINFKLYTLAVCEA